MHVNRFIIKGFIISWCTACAAHASSSFQGFRIGLKAGYSVNNSRFQRKINKADRPRGQDDKFNLSGQSCMGGAILEYNHIFSEAYLVGAQINASWANVKGKTTHYNSGVPQSVSNRLTMKQSYGIALRLGYVIEKTLPYIKLGLVTSKWQSETNGAPLLGQGSATKYRTGCELGGGIDYPINPHLTIGPEFVHIWRQKLSYSNRATNGALLHTIKVYSQTNIILLNLKLKI